MVRRVFDDFSIKYYLNFASSVVNHFKIIFCCNYALFKYKIYKYHYIKFDEPYSFCLYSANDRTIDWTIENDESVLPLDDETINIALN